ncbi:T9SS type A sorting domain-containing protein [Crocinitomix catalasitica]|nr:T9SS type A sorting domain-containing protein [Crocinitomix catalasitica]
MKKIFTLLACVSLSFGVSAQTVFESDLSTWAAGDPVDWMGSVTSIPSTDVIEQTVGVTYGTSLAQLINTSSTHVRFTTIDIAVTPGETYEITMYVAALNGDLRTNYYDVTNAAYGTYNPYFDLSVESGGTLVALSQTVTVPGTCSDMQVILSLRNTDGFGIAVDSVNVQVGTAAPPTVVSIYDIQFNTTSPFESPYETQNVTTKGVVTGVFQFGAGTNTFFIQDGVGPYTGIYIYDTGASVTLGDSVSVTGTVTEFFTLTEINAVTDITILNSGNPDPTAWDVTTAGAVDEENEGVLCRLVDAICTNEDAGFGQFEVDDGSGVRLVDDEIFSYTPTLGNAYSIVGVNFLSFGEVKIYPRQLSDITTTGFNSIDGYEMGTLFYPNPVENVLQLNILPDDEVSIYDLTGSLVYKGTGVSSIDVSGLASGAYQIVIGSDDTFVTDRLIIR